MQFKIDTQELEASNTQAHSLPVKDLDHPMLGKRVAVQNGLHKGYTGYIRAAGNASVTIELNTLFNSPVSPNQTFAWGDIRLLYRTLPPPNPSENQYSLSPTNRWSIRTDKPMSRTILMNLH